MATSARGIAAMTLILSACTVASGLSAGHATSPVPSGGRPIAMTGDDTERRMLTVPDVIGKTPEEARAIVKAAGFTADVELNAGLHCEGAPQNPGRINCQDPDAGKIVSRYAMVQITVYQPATHPGSLVREQLEALRGLSPDDARARLKQLGHVGKVTVGVVVSFDPKCGQNKVCDTSHDGGMDIHDDLELHLNPKLQISTPP